MGIRDVGEGELYAAQRAGDAVLSAVLREFGDPENQEASVWWLHRRTLPDGRVLYLRPMGFGMLYLQLSPDAQAQHFNDTWCYGDDARDAAWRSAIGWDGEGEPEGWFRHPQSGRSSTRCPGCARPGPVCSGFAELVCEHCGARFRHYPGQ